MSIEFSLEPSGNSISQLLQGYAEDATRDIDKDAFELASFLREETIRGWPVDTGASRAGWQGPTKLGEGHYEIRNEYAYAGVIEYGGYRGVGPKTASGGNFVLPGGIEVGGGIFPTQKPSAPLRRGFSKTKLKFEKGLLKGQ
jgi:hypothetical protein